MIIKCESDYMLTCAMIDNEAHLKDYNKKEINADIICEESSGKFEFIHLTYTDCIVDILDEGFLPGDGILGEGVYVVNPRNKKSLTSLINFYTDLCEGEDEMTLIRGMYNGPYVKSLLSIDDRFLYTEGFILLKDVSKIQITKHYNLPVAHIENHLKKLHCDDYIQRS